MVGGKSLGCKTCKKRRVKCDERRPICANCEKGGRYCSGALSPFLHYKALPASSKAGASDEEGSSFDIESVGENESRQRLTKRVNDDQRLLKTVPSSPQSFLAQSLIDSLTNSPSGFRVQNLGSFFEFVPSRIGHTPLLDAATDCLLHGQRSLMELQPGGTAEDLKRYGYALNLLRHEIGKLECRKEKASPELVCAVMMLASFGLLTQELGSPYLIHVGGVSDLIQAWGPENVKSDFEHALFDSHHGGAVSNALVMDKNCFVSEPSWVAVQKRAARLRLASKRQHQFFDAQADLAVLPGLLREVRSARRQSQEGTLYPATVLSLIHRALLLRENVLRSGTEAGMGLNSPFILVETPSLDIDSPGAPLSIYQYSSKFIAGNHCHYWACQILANRLLCTLYALQTYPGTNLETLAGPELLPPSYDPILLEEESCNFAERIRSSLPYFRRHAPLGSMAIIFGCQLALTTNISADKKAWIMKEAKEQLGVTALQLSVDYLEITGSYLTGGEINIGTHVRGSHFGQYMRKT